MKKNKTFKKIVRPFYQIYKNFIYKIKQKIKLKRIIHKSLEKTHQYWKTPYNNENLPELYLKGLEKSRFLLDLIIKYTSKESKILEIGCNIGRNLDVLYSAGFKNLETIEISKTALDFLKKYFPKMADNIKIHNIAIENIIKDFSDNTFELVFTMAVLEHIHDKSSWIFKEIVRITKNYLITIEDEKGISWRHFPRNYKKIFESLKTIQIKEINCVRINKLGKTFFARVFKKLKLSNI